MKVKVIKTSISNPTKGTINANMDDYLELGREFVVYAITKNNNSCYFQIFDDNHLVSIPSELFEITDRESSKYWEVRIDEDKVLKLWPKEFFNGYFHEDLADGEPEVVKIFENIKKKMTNEI